MKILSLIIFFAWLAVDAPIYKPNVPPLHIYGGEGHRVFLGCINCASEQKSSIWNKSSPHGRLSSNTSIWNRKGPFGSKDSEFSPWNPKSTKGPVLLDESGKYYGRFTANRENEQTTIDWAIWIVENHEEVRRNISKYRQHYSAANAEQP